MTWKARTINFFLSGLHTSTCNTNLSMQVIVNDLNKTYAVDVEPTTTVGELKTKIQSASGCPIEKQQLADCDRKNLLNDDNKTLSHYHVKNESRLNLTIKLRGGMVIYVKLVTGRTVTLDVDPHDTVENIKQSLINNGWLEPTTQQAVIQHAGHELEDGRSLADYNIKPEASIYIAIVNKWKGGWKYNWIKRKLHQL